jgi:LacI family transcriptional regulator
VLGEYEGARSAHAYLCVYLGWSELFCGRAPILPVLRMKHVEEEALLGWLDRNQPDVLIFAHHYNALVDFDRILLRHKIAVPGSLGVAVMTQILEGTRFSGLQANPRMVGEWAVELLVARIMNHDFGVPFHPRMEMAEMDWVDGQSLRLQTT